MPGRVKETEGKIQVFGGKKGGWGEERKMGGRSGNTQSS